MDVETKHASLDTLSITILALHVNGKQMTLAVFRQLPIGDDFEMNDPQRWGIVRYPIKEEGDVWLVFSGDGKLYRRAVRVEEDEHRLAPHRHRVDQYQLHIENIKKGKLIHPGDQKLRQMETELAQARHLWEEEERAEARRMEMDQKLVDTLPQLFIAV